MPKNLNQSKTKSPILLCLLKKKLNASLVSAPPKPLFARWMCCLSTHTSQKNKPLSNPWRGNFHTIDANSTFAGQTREKLSPNFLKHILHKLNLLHKRLFFSLPHVTVFHHHIIKNIKMEAF